MGSPFTITLYTRDSVQGMLAISKAFTLVDSLNNIYSDYLPTSELNRLCQRSGSGEWVPVSEPLFEILEKSKKASRLSKGTFDITISPLSRLWRSARKEGNFPPGDSLRKALQKVGYRKMKLSTGKRSVKLAEPGMQLDLGGIAKGDIAQRVVNLLLQLNMPFALADAGGDIVAGKAPPGKNGWRIGVNLPGSEMLQEDQLEVEQIGVATSGDLYQYMIFQGKRYSHLINPRNGMPLTNGKNVTVIAADGATADWLTKACSILPKKKPFRLIGKFRGAAVQITWSDSSGIESVRSKSFQKYLAK